MSVALIGLVVDRFDAKPHLKLTMTLLANYADEHGDCWPSYDTLAALMCCSRRTVINNVGELVANGYLEILEKGGRYRDWKGRSFYRTNVFRINVAKLAVLPKLVPSRSPQTSVDGCSPLHVRGEVHRTPRKREGVKPTSPEPLERYVNENHHGEAPVDNLIKSFTASHRMTD